MKSTRKALHLTFHGRILEHLGIQMYQSPVAALSELISNSWDAESESVQIELPTSLSNAAVIIVRDNGLGMTFEECQDKYLRVGWNRRGEKPDEYSPNSRRPILGRKGIGKFAGFGIAKKIQVETVSKENGEKTIFLLDLDDLLMGEYVEKDKIIPVIEYHPPDKERRKQHGTTVILDALTIRRTPNPEQFRTSMARRFLLHKEQDFEILVNGKKLPEGVLLKKAQFVFPRDYENGENPGNVEEVDRYTGWGTEKLAGGWTIQWRFLFLPDPIDVEEMKGISVFAKGKMVQVPFLFNLTGGLGGQHGVEYLTGQVRADFLDSLPQDLVATERQRINWGDDVSNELLQWGQKRIKELLIIWRDRRGQKRKQELQQKISGFEVRLSKLPTRERKVVERALRKVCSVPQLTENDLQELGNSMLTAWEQGRLRDLIADISEIEEMSVEEILKLFTEAKVLTALNLAEAVKTKIVSIENLEKLVQKRHLENELRDFLAKNPYLLDPKWETFKVERRVNTIIKDAAKISGLGNEEYKGRIDLALASGKQLLVIELMRPGLTLNWDHLSRCEQYVMEISSQVEATSALGISDIFGLVVADKLSRIPRVVKKIKALEKEYILVHSWNTLLEEAKKTWNDFMEILVDRAPEDERLQSLHASHGR